MMTRTRWLATLLAIAVVATAASAGLAHLLRPERVAAWAAARASAALDREVTIERAGVRVLPRPAVSLAGVSISSTPGDEGPLLRAERIELRPRLRPLLRRQVVIDDVVAFRAGLRIVVLEDGTTNLPDVESGVGGEDPDIRVDVRRIGVRDGALRFADHRDGSTAELRGIEQRLELGTALEGGTLELAGRVSAREMDLTLADLSALSFQGLPVRLDHVLHLDRAADRLEISHLRLELDAVPLEGIGRVLALSDGSTRAVDLRLASGDLDLARLGRTAAGAGLVGEGDPSQAVESLRGRGGMEIQVSGPLGAGHAPEVAGVLRVVDASFAWPGAGRVAEALSATLRFGPGGIRSDDVVARVLGAPGHATFRLDELADPRLSLWLRTSQELERVGRAGWLPDAVGGQGRAHLDAGVTARASSLETVRLTGTVALEGVSLVSGSLDQPVLVREGRIRLDGGVARAEALRLAHAGAEVDADVTVADWLPSALGLQGPLPSVRFEARTARLDLDALLGAERGSPGYGELLFARLRDQRVAGRPVEELAREAGLGLPRFEGVRLEGRLVARSALRGGVEFEDVDLSLAAANGAAELLDGRFRMRSPGVRVVGRLGRSAGVPASGGIPATVEYAVEDDGAEEFLGRFHAFDGRLTGSFGVAGQSHMQLDETLLPIRESLVGEGALELRHARLVNWPIARALGRQLGLAQFEVLDLTAGAGRYVHHGARFELDRWLLEAGDLRAGVEGSFDLGGGLDLAAGLELPRALAALADGSPAAPLLRAASTHEGRLPLAFRVGGTVEAPTVRLDLEPVRTRLAASAREAAERRAEEAARRAAGALLERIGN